MITVTHFGGLKIRINPAHIAALIPDGILRGAGETIDGATKAAIVLSSGTAYHVRETIAAIEKLIKGAALIAALEPSP